MDEIHKNTHVNLGRALALTQAAVMISMAYEKKKIDLDGMIYLFDQIRVMLDETKENAKSQ
jgi:uncharacterized protein YrrD